MSDYHECDIWMKSLYKILFINSQESLFYVYPIFFIYTLSSIPAIAQRADTIWYADITYRFEVLKSLAIKIEDKHDS